MQSKPIRAFDRGLAGLATLNRHGSATALALSRESGIPRATVYRLLQTLQDAGYVGRGTADDRYHLRLKVRGLSEGFQDEQWISAIAGPALAALRGRGGGPCDGARRDGWTMVIHETTHRIAPLSIDRNMVGREMPVLGSSSGLAYIAFAPAAHRDALLDLLAASDNPNDGLARDRTQVGRLIAATRRLRPAARRRALAAHWLDRAAGASWRAIAGMHQHGVDGARGQCPRRRAPLLEPAAGDARPDRAATRQWLSLGGLKGVQPCNGLHDHLHPPRMVPAASITPARALPVPTSTPRNA